MVSLTIQLCGGTLANGLQPNAFASAAIEAEILATSPSQPINNSVSGISLVWNTVFIAAALGQFIPVPFLNVKVTNPFTLDSFIAAFQGLAKGTLPQASFPDMRNALWTDRRAEMGLGVTNGLDGSGIIAGACLSCHNSKLNQALSSQKFNADFSKMGPEEKQVAIARLLLKTSDPLVMPPLRFMTLTPEEIALAIEALK